MSKCWIVFVKDDHKTGCDNEGREYIMYDGGKIILCDIHANWQSALGKA